MQRTLENVLEALSHSWGPDTAQNPSPYRGPASGQCAVSSMIIQEWFGGDLLRAVVKSWPTARNGIVHYWNRLPSGVWVDSTRDQFYNEEVPYEIMVRPPEYLYKFEDTVERYERLKVRVLEYLENNA